MKEDNKLLAEFLGWEDNQDDSFETPFYWEDANASMAWNAGRYDFKIECMKFNYDWNWLMMVVEKIETLSLQPEFFVMYDSRKEFKGWYWNISVRKLFNKDCLNRESTKIVAYYNACIEFVKWYNKQ